MFRFRAIPLITTLVLFILVTACGGQPEPQVTTGDGAQVQVLFPEVDSLEMAIVGDEPLPEESIAVDFENDLEEFDSTNFHDPTNIDNEWFSLQPGMRWVYEGETVETGLSTPHRVIFTVTDLTKVIDGVRAVVVWDQDYSADVLVETELALFAQDNDGNVWHLGQYPEVYENGRLVETPAWIHGLQGARAGISMKAEPQFGAPSYSQGWGPAVNWTDRAQVAEIGVENCVPFDCYENVLVIEEFSQEELGAFQLKYYAPGVGNVRVGWRGDDATRETLELVDFVQLGPEALAEARAEALELEKRAYEINKEVYGQTPPAE